MNEVDPEERYHDPDLKLSNEPGLLDDSSLRWVQSLIQRVIDDKGAMTNLIGKMLSEPRRQADEGPYSSQSFDDVFASGRSLKPSASSQVLYSLGEGSELTLFAGGEVIELDFALLPVVKALVSVDGLKANDFGLDREFMDMLEDLWEQGTLLFH